MNEGNIIKLKGKTQIPEWQKRKMITDAHSKGLMYFAIGMDTICVLMNIACIPTCESIIVAIEVIAISTIFCILLWFLLGARTFDEYRKDQEVKAKGEAIEGIVVDIHEEEIGFHAPEKTSHYTYTAEIRLIDGRVITTKSLNKRPKEGAKSITHFYKDRVVTEIEDIEDKQ